MLCQDLLRTELPLTFYQVIIHSSGYASEERESEDTIFRPSKNKINVRVGDAILEHKLGLKVPDSGDFYREDLIIESDADENRVGVSLHSADREFMAGHDMQQINRVGAVIYLGIEDFFERYVDHGNIVDNARLFNVTASTYDLIITPKFKVTQNDFKATMNTIVGYVNQVMRVLEEQHSKVPVYLKEA